jgi:hypothetical protein
LQPIIEITEQLVDQYIQRALPSAESSADRLAIKLAFAINVRVTKNRASLQKGAFVDHIWASGANVHASRVVSDNKETKEAANITNSVSMVHSLRTSALQEIHETLCTKKNRAKKLTGANKQSVDQLVNLIAVAVATHTGFAVGIATALVVALLRFVYSIGVSTFCKRYKAGLLFE